MDVGAAVVVICVAFLASIGRGLTGFGFALIVVPFFLLVLDVRDTVVVSSLLGFAGVSLLALRVRRDVPWGTVSWLLVGSLAGMPLGLAALLFAPQEPLRIGVGVLVLIMAGTLARGLSIEGGGVMRELLVGVASGILKTSTSISGPPVVLYLQGRGCSPEQFRAALSMFFLLGYLVSVGAFIATDVISGKALVLTALALPAVSVGVWTGDRLLRWVGSTLFRRLVLLLLTATALSSIGASAFRLLG